MAGSRCGEDAILSDQELLHSICSADLGNQLDHLWVVVSAIPANDEEASFNALRDRKEDAGDERLAVVGLLENFDLFPKS